MADEQSSEQEQHKPAKRQGPAEAAKAAHAGPDPIDEAGWTNTWPPKPTDGK